LVEAVQPVPRILRGGRGEQLPKQILDASGGADLIGSIVALEPPRSHWSPSGPSWSPARK
jgi:hypothetical protein